MSMQAIALDPSAPAPLFRAQARAWTAGVVGEVVDESLDRARELREKAAAERAERDAREQRAAAREAREMKLREEAEARDARALAELYASKRKPLAA
ncbi:MAG: hypothetical protein ACOYN0_10735 [Phycisphaerales bacterium]